MYRIIFSRISDARYEARWAAEGVRTAIISIRYATNKGQLLRRYDDYKACEARRRQAVLDYLNARGLRNYGGISDKLFYHFLRRWY